MQQGVECNSKNCSEISTVDPVGPKFKNSLIDGYKLSLAPGAAVKLIELINKDTFVISNDL